MSLHKSSKKCQNKQNGATSHSVGFTTYNQMDATTAMGHKDAQKIALGIKHFCL